ncbi:MAG: BON domain-containing protein [Rhodoferax sp.]|nr:BON domain-containing protein [Rhodoferax sp.]
MSTSNTPRISVRHGVALAVAAFMAFGAVANASAQDTAKDKMEKTEKKVEKAVTDSWITTKVKSEILANSVSKAFKVNVVTKAGVVHLKGELPTQDSIDLVKMIAEKVKGVNSVDVSGLTKVS